MVHVYKNGFALLKNSKKVKMDGKKMKIVSVVGDSIG
jgi:hypothetical protein